MSCTLLTHIPAEHFNSERDASDRLNSDPLCLQVALSDAALSVLGASLPKREVSDGDVIRAFKGLLSVEIVGVNGDVLNHYTENDVGEAELTPIPPRKFDVSGAAAWLPWAKAASKGAITEAPFLSLEVDRRFPLSSSQGNQPFRLSLAFGPEDAMEVMVSTPFRVQAKRPKNGTAPKVKRLEKTVGVGQRRRAHLDAVAGVVDTTREVPSPATTPPRAPRKAASVKRSWGDSVADSDGEEDGAGAAAGAGRVGRPVTRGASKRVRCASVEDVPKVVMPSQPSQVPASQLPVSQLPFSQPYLLSQGSMPGSPLASVLGGFVGEPLRLSQTLAPGALTPMFSHAGGCEFGDMTPLASLDLDSVGDAFGVEA